MITARKPDRVVRGRSRVRRSLLVASLATMGLVTIPGVASGAESIDPASVERTVYPGDSFDVDKTVGTNDIPPKVDVCLLQDETGSFGDDIANLKNPGTIAAIFNGVRAQSPDSQFAVSGFRDLPFSPFGQAGDWVYRSTSVMSPDFSAWSAGVNLLNAGGGGDLPEAQYPAIRAAVNGGFDSAACGFRADPQVARVLVVTTDAAFHTTADNAVYGDLTSTLAVLNTANVTVIGLKAPGAGSELDDLAVGTGGTVQPLSSNGANIVAAILAGLGNLPVEVAMTSTCVDPISTTFAPASQSVTSGDNALFTETIAVAAGAAGGTYTCVDNVSYNGVVSETVVETKTINVIGIELSPVTATNELGVDLSHTVTATVSAGDVGPIANAAVDITVTSGPNTGQTVSGNTDANGQLSLTWTPAVAPSSLGSDSITADLKNPAGDVVASDDAGKQWVDTTPPSATCVASVNPNGKNIPKAPGNGGQGQNQDGFYLIGGSDVVWGSDVDVYVVDDGSGTVFGPYAPDTNIKYTQAPGATPTEKSIGGPNSAVKLHITGKGDAAVYTVDGSGNKGGPTSCLVPPAPK